MIIVLKAVRHPGECLVCLDAAAPRRRLGHKAPLFPRRAGYAWTPRRRLENYDIIIGKQKRQNLPCDYGY